VRESGASVTSGVTVVVATFGDPKWTDVADRFAIPSADISAADHVVYVHGDTLHGARNEALSEVTTPYVIFLDADDRITPGYVEAMLRCVQTSHGDMHVCAPMVQYCRPDGASEPAHPRVAGHTHRVCRPSCLIQGNWIVIGAMATTALVRAVGGFKDFGYEDWALWVACYQAGAKFHHSRAVYQANIRAGSRGGYSAADSLRHHVAVAEAYGLPIPEQARKGS